MTQKPNRRDAGGNYVHLPYIFAYTAAHVANLLSLLPRWVSDPVLWCMEYLVDMVKEIDA